jgi:hypothetical protein
VRAADLSSLNVFGLALDEPEPQIWLNNRASRGSQQRTLVHEFFEIVNNIYDLGLTETHIRVFEQATFQSFHVRPRTK